MLESVLIGPNSWSSTYTVGYGFDWLLLRLVSPRLVRKFDRSLWMTSYAFEPRDATISSSVITCELYISPGPSCGCEQPTAMASVSMATQRAIIKPPPAKLRFRAGAA